VSKILTGPQTQRLKQIGLQQRGAGAFLEVSVADALQLTPKQKDAIRKVMEESGPPRKPGRFDEPPMFPRRRTEGHFRELTARAAELLTETQRKRWSAMIGEPAAVPFRPPMPEGFGLPPFPGPR
jgi:hypothetical protein